MQRSQVRGATAHGTAPHRLLSSSSRSTRTELAKVIYARGATQHPKITDLLAEPEWPHRRPLPGPSICPTPTCRQAFWSSIGLLHRAVSEGDLHHQGRLAYAGLSPANPLVRPKQPLLLTAALPFRPIWHEIRIPEHSSVGVASGQTIQLAATLYCTPAAGAAAAGDPQSRSANVCRRCEWRGPGISKPEARFFLARGFNVAWCRCGRAAAVEVPAGPMTSSGPPFRPPFRSIPLSKTRIPLSMRCAPEPWVDPARIPVVAGWSRGGGLSVVFTPRVTRHVGVIYFSGGWWKRDEGKYEPETSGAEEHQMRELLAAAGKTARVPELWLYADNDMFFSLAYARKIFDAFHANGGTGDFLAFGKVSGGCRTAPPAMVTHCSSMSACGKLRWQLICGGLKTSASRRGGFVGECIVSVQAST